MLTPIIQIFAVPYDVALALKRSVVGYCSSPRLLAVLTFAVITATEGCATHQPVAIPTPISPREDFIEAIGNIKRSVAPVVCVEMGTPDWKLISVEGTAFFIGADGEFVTPAHVIEGLTLPNRIKPCPVAAIYLPENGWQISAANFRVKFKAFIHSTCRISKDIDTAICRTIEKLDGVPAVTFESSFPPDGTPVAFTGFPLSRSVPISSIGSIAGYQDATKDNRGPMTIVVDKNNWPGASGSPIYLRSGKVIGMITARGIGDATGLAYGKTAAFIIRLIDLGR